MSFPLLMVFISPNFQKWTRHYCAIADEKLSFSDDIEQNADEDSSKVMAVFYCLSISSFFYLRFFQCLHMCIFYADKIVEVPYQITSVGIKN